MIQHDEQDNTQLLACDLYAQEFITDLYNVNYSYYTVSKRKVKDF